MKKKLAILFCLSAFLSAFAETNDSVPVYKIVTTVGDITVKLYPETVKHRDNFVKLADKGYYNGLLFHRVINNFMIQAGDPKSKTASKGAALGSGDTGYTIPAEILYPQYYHKKGALAAARQGDDTNPKRASSGGQFYLVKGKVLSEGMLYSFERDRQRKEEKELFDQIIASQKEKLKKLQIQKNQTAVDILNDSVMAVVRQQVREKGDYKIAPKIRQDYKTIGGVPHLDNAYTVFGEITDGLNVLDSISNVKVDNNNRPLTDIRIISIKRVE